MNDFRDLTINDLYIVSQLPNFRSIRALANHISISAPAVSKKINSIEKKLDFNLIKRSSTGISITNEGLLGAKWANEIISKTSSLPSKLKNLNSKQHLIIGSRGFLIASLLPSIVSSFDEKYKLSFIDLSPVDTMKLMQNQQIDISITLDKKSLGENWESFYIGELVWELMASSQNRIPKNIELIDLDKYQIAHSTFYDGQTVIQGEDFLKIPQKYKSHGHGIQNTFSAINLAIHSKQLVYVPKLAALEALNTNKLKIINLKHVKRTSNPIYLNINIDKVSKNSLDLLIKNLEDFLTKIV